MPRKRKARQGKALSAGEGSWAAAFEGASGGVSASSPPLPAPRRRVTVDTTEARKMCAKPGCGQWSSEKHPIYRHHMGCDSYIGIWNKGILYNYHRWLDCVYLCEDHHCEIHYIYEPYLSKWVNRTAQGARDMRAFLIKICQRWLSGDIPTPRLIPKAYKDNFHKRLLKWQKAASQETG